MAAAAGAPVGAPQQSGTKLSTPEVFDRIREITCRVLSSLGESTGCLLAGGVVLTVHHNVPTEDLDFITIVRGDVDYFPSASDDLNEHNTKALDLYSLQTRISDYSAITNFSGELREGMSVYFSGYPLGQESMTFHKGTISSTTLLTDGVQSFTIDGTVVPGCSGGPVVVQDEGNVYLIGVITSEIADLEEGDMQTMRIVSHYLARHQNEISDQTSGERAIGLIHSGQTPEYYVDPVVTTSADAIVPDYLDTLVPITDREISIRAMGLISRNFSTGVGRALNIHSKDCLFRGPDIEIPEGSCFPVARGNGLAKGQIGGIKYMEKRYGSGKGPRGIRLNGDNYKAIIYKFTDNPHFAPGNYNSNQAELYDKAAKYLSDHHSNEPPTTFSFEACGHTYAANLE